MCVCVCVRGRERERERERQRERERFVCGTPGFGLLFHSLNFLFYENFKHISNKKTIAPNKIKVSGKEIRS